MASDEMRPKGPDSTFESGADSLDLVHEPAQHPPQQPFAHLHVEGPAGGADHGVGADPGGVAEGP